MKKRLLSVLLAVALCLSCLTPLALAAAAGSEDNAISADVPEGLRQAASGLTAAPESKATPSYSQIMPHMSMDDACGVVGDTMKLYFALRNRRSYDQWAVMIYQGANTGDDNVVGGTYDSYDTNYEFSDLTLSIDPSELWLAAGTYTVLAFTFTGSIDSPNVIEDSIVSFQFKMVSRAIPLQGISFYGLSADMTVNLNGYLQTCLLLSAYQYHSRPGRLYADLFQS